MVFEFTELQGEIGSIYAKINNFNDVVGVISDYRKDPEKTLEKMRL